MKNSQSSPLVNPYTTTEVIRRWRHVRSCVGRIITTTGAVGPLSVKAGSYMQGLLASEPEHQRRVFDSTPSCARMGYHQADWMALASWSWFVIPAKATFLADRERALTRARKLSPPCFSILNRYFEQCSAEGSTLSPVEVANQIRSFRRDIRERVSGEAVSTTPYREKPILAIESLKGKLVSVEVECYVGDYTDLSLSGCRSSVTADGSLTAAPARRSGREFRFTHILKDGRLPGMEVHLARFAKVNSPIGNATCGLHVHVDVRDIVGEHIRRYVYDSTLHTLSALLALVPEHRRHSMYCLPWSSWLGESRDEDGVQIPGVPVVTPHKYRAINGTHLLRRGTIEFRLQSSMMERCGMSGADGRWVTDVSRWSELCAEVVRLARERALSAIVTLDQLSTLVAPHLRPWITARAEEVAATSVAPARASVPSVSVPGPRSVCGLFSCSPDEWYRYGSGPSSRLWLQVPGLPENTVWSIHSPSGYYALPLSFGRCTNTDLSRYDAELENYASNRVERYILAHWRTLRATGFPAPEASLVSRMVPLSHSADDLAVCRRFGVHACGEPLRDGPWRDSEATVWRTSLQAIDSILIGNRVTLHLRASLTRQLLHLRLWYSLRLRGETTPGPRALIRDLYRSPSPDEIHLESYDGLLAQVPADNDSGDSNVAPDMRFRNTFNARMTLQIGIASSEILNAAAIHGRRAAMSRFESVLASWCQETDARGRAASPHFARDLINMAINSVRGCRMGGETCPWIIDIPMSHRMSTDGVDSVTVPFTRDNLRLVISRLHDRIIRSRAIAAGGDVRRSRALVSALRLYCLLRLLHRRLVDSDVDVSDVRLSIHSIESIYDYQVLIWSRRSRLWPDFLASVLQSIPFNS